MGVELAIGAAIVGGVAGLAAGGVSAAGQLEGARRERKAGREASNVETRIAGEQLEQEREETRRVLAIQRASAGAAGLSFQGTPALVSLDSVFQSIRERERIISRATQRARLARRQGRSASARLTLGATGSILGGLSQAGSAFSRAGQISASANARSNRATSSGTTP